MIAVEAIYEANFNFSVVLAKINGSLDKKDNIIKNFVESQKVSNEDAYSSSIDFIVTTKIYYKHMHIPNIVMQIIN